jgi:hypothetical protein
MDIEKINELNKIACQEKNKTFKYKQFTIRSTYGISQLPCCGNNCMYCIYGVKRGSTEVIDIKKLEW